MSEEILKKFTEAELLLTPDALQAISSMGKPAEFAELILAHAREKELLVIDKTVVERLAKEEEKIPLPIEVHRPPSFRPLAKEHEGRVRVMRAGGESSCGGQVSDFVKHFRDRFRRIRRMLEARSPSGITSMAAMRGMTRGREVRLIGMVRSKTLTRKGDLLVELEDEEGIAKVWVGKGRNEQERQCFEKARSLMLDDVVAFDGKASDPFLIASDILWPDIPVRTTKTIEEDLAVAFISDTHVGSRLFMEKQFGAMLRWLKGEVGDERSREIAGRVKYITLAGDLVDGIGIYPKQEKDLTIKDVFEQYREFAKLLESVPDYIEVIASPGNHDAVRRAEPQPVLPEEIAEAFSHLPNFHLVGSPAWVEIEGLKTLIYHGTSLDSVIASIPGMSYARPEMPMIELLKRRHLSPTFGENPIVPEESDGMLVEEVPDIVHMGHVHHNAFEKYRGTVVVNSGTWQDRTDYQVRLGHIPTPCILPVYGLRTAELVQVNFNEQAGVM